MSTDPISKYDSHGFNYCTTKHDTYPYITPLSTTSNLTGRYVLITGASRGIGLGTALSFARAGATGIALLARSSLPSAAAQVREAALAAGHPPPTIITAAVDVASQDQVYAAGETVRAAFGGRLDAVVLNAGKLEHLRRIADQEPSEWREAFEISVFGAFLCLHVFIPMLRGTKGGLGTVVGTTSVGATMASGAGASGLQTSKLAVSRLMEHVNAENEGLGEGETKLLAYSIHPGAVDHPDRTDLPEALHKMSVDTVELAGDTTAWLIRERREWLAGRFISVNWDMEEFLAKRPEIERRDLLKFRLAMGGEDPSKF